MMKSNMLKILIIFFGIFFQITIFAAKSAIIAVPVANMFQDPNENAAVTSQAIYGSKILIQQSARVWSYIATDDGYHGWMKNSDLSPSSYESENVIKIKSLFANVYSEPNNELHKPLMTLAAGIIMPLINVKDKDWVEVKLVNGNVGWIRYTEVWINPKPMTIPQMLTYSKNFLGLPYLWGGVSTFGFDCSGWVQFMYRQMGIILPRDNMLQVTWPRFVEVTKENLKPGDTLYFGFDHKITHTAIYLGNNLFIQMTAYLNPILQIGDLRAKHWQEVYITARHLDPNYGKYQKFSFSINELSPEIQDKMRQYTWHEGCPVPLSQLVLLKLIYWGFDERPHFGEMIVNRQLAPEISEIFKELYLQHFPIEKMRPIEEYKGDDNASMIDDNTSAFNCRKQTDFSNLYSIHSYGAAIDINPLINPYINDKKVDPKEGEINLDRATYHKGKIYKDNAAYNAFIKHGWNWGGDWQGKIRDYQHFEKHVE